MLEITICIKNTGYSQVVKPLLVEKEGTNYNDIDLQKFPSQVANRNNRTNTPPYAASS